VDRFVPCLTVHRDGSVLTAITLGHPLVDDYLAFVAQNRTAQGDPVVEFEHDVTVRAQRRHGVSRPDAQGGQQSGERPGTRAELGVGEAHLAVDYGRPVPEDPLRELEEGRRRQL